MEPSPTKLFTLREVVGILSLATGIEPSLIRERFRGWVHYGWITCETIKGVRSGTRREYGRMAIIQAVFILQVSEFRGGPVLCAVGAYVKANIQEIEKHLLNPRELLVIEMPGRKAWNHTPIAFKFFEDAAFLLNYMDTHDIFLVVGMRQVLLGLQECTQLQ